MNKFSAMEAAARIAARSQELGFSAIGFAPALPPPHHAAFRRWLKQGWAGTMSYLVRTAEVRRNVRRVLPGARTVICAAFPYFCGWLPEELRRDPARGVIAVYACGSDYHHVVGTRLEELASFVRELFPDSRTFCSVDAQPVMERGHALRAQIGFQGKNALLILPRQGSFLFLGTVVTTAALPRAPQAQLPSCGTCQRCLDACPTRAFVAPYVLDASRCISYLTTSFKGVIPRALRPLIGNRIYGCDDCQTCCPWNLHFAVPASEPAFRSTPERQAPLLCDLATMTREDFETRFADSVILHTGYKLFLRNVAVALGNWQSLEALPSLERLLHHEEPLVRAHALWAAQRIPHPRAQALVRLALAAETHPDVLAEATEA